MHQSDFLLSITKKEKKEKKCTWFGHDILVTDGNCGVFLFENIFNHLKE